MTASPFQSHDFWFAERFRILYRNHMECLHAPWRIQYILAPKEAAPPGESSLFTRLAQATDDEANYVVARRKTCFVLLNRYPYNGGHLMVVPYKQVPDLSGLSDCELSELFTVVRTSQEVLRTIMKPDGFNIGINVGKVAGAGIVEHLHVHIVPRWAGDTNFMPVLAQTGVVPEALRELAARLREGFNL
jgi:ATP adenylyltransferase